MKCLSSLICLALFAVVAVEAEDKPKFKLTEDEQKILDMTNKERADRDLPPLKLSETLTKIARAHSANMAKQGKMEHVLDGKKPSDRLLDAGYDYGEVRENIASGYNWSIDAVMKGWMESKTHRTNILAGDVNEIGIGVASDDKGNDYYTQDFAKKRK